MGNLLHLVTDTKEEFRKLADEIYKNLPDFYQEKRDFFCEQIKDSRFTFEPAKSTFFQILDYSNISDEVDLDLCKRWTREIGVASIPLTVFCETPFTGSRLRFCFAKDNDTLREAAEKLCAL